MPDIGVSKDALRNVVGITGQFVGTTDTQTITNKTISLSNNTFTVSGEATGDILKSYGPGVGFGRLAMGAGSKALLTNSGATDIGWGTVSVAGGGTGQTSLTSGAVLIGAGTSGITTKTNPAGAFVGDSDTQTFATGGKTFNDQILKLRNPANTQTLTFRNPVITSSQDYRFQSPPFLYYIFKEGSTYYMKSAITKGIESSNSDAGILIQAAITAVLATSRGGLIGLSGDEFPISAVLDIPCTTSNPPLGLVGTYSNNRDRGTMLTATSSFPDNHSIIETSGATDTSNKFAVLYLKDIGMQNVANFNTKTIGGLKFEIDYAAYRRALIVDGFFSQYLQKGITLQGSVWWSYLKNLTFEAFSASFTGGVYDIKLEQTGTYTHTNPATNGWPKSNHFDNIIAVRNPGTMVNSLWVDSGGYNTFNNYMVDGTAYTDGTFRFGSSGNPFCTDNNMWTPWTLDENEPGAQVGCLILEGTNTTNNRFYNAKLSRNAYHATIKGGAYRNYIQLAGYWGAHASINNSGCGEYNVIEMIHGALAAASAPNKLTLSGNATDNGKCRIIDNRKGAYNTGVSTQSGNASTVAFNIAHGLFTTPLTYSVTPQTSDAAGTPIVTATSTNLVVTYPIAPPTGSSNLIWVWTAGIY